MPNAETKLSRRAWLKNTGILLLSLTAGAYLVDHSQENRTEAKGPPASTKPKPENTPVQKNLKPAPDEASYSVKQKENDAYQADKKEGNDDTYEVEQKEEIKNVPEDKENLITESFGPIYKTQYDKRAIVNNAENGQTNSFNVHGEVDYRSRPDSFDLLWFGEDYKKTSDGTILSPVNGKVIRTEKEGDYGYYLDIETYIKTPNKLLRAIVRIHHTEFERPKVDTIIKIGQSITKESFTKESGLHEHVHVGCVIEDPENEGSFMAIPFSSLQKSNSKSSGSYKEVFTTDAKGNLIWDQVPLSTTNYMKDYTDKAAPDEEYFNKVFQNLKKYGLILPLNQGTSQQAKEEKPPEKEAEIKAKESLIFGFFGYTYEEMAKNPAFELCNGIVLMTYNYSSEAQVTKLVKDLHEKGKKTVYVDHEGGKVMRIKLGEDTAPGQITTESQAYELGRNHGQLLKKVGIDVNLAPLADIYNGSAVIKDRAFGSNNPELVAKMVAAYVRGLQEFGVNAVLKHWPGHGSVVQDTHYLLGTLQNISDSDMTPFIAGINAGATMVMPGHIAVTKIDGNTPATKSKKLLTRLKELLGQNIVLISDELGMLGAGSDPLSSAYQMLSAGIDKILYVELQGRTNIDQTGAYRKAVEFFNSNRTINNVEENSTTEISPTPIYRVETDKKYLFLTLDVCPRKDFEFDIKAIKTATDKKIPLMLFVSSGALTSLTSENISFLKDLQKKGLLTIGSHGDTHLDASKVSLSDWQKDVENSITKLTPVFGKPKFFRFPYDESAQLSDEAKRKVVTKNGMWIISHSLATGDPEGISVTEITQTIEKNSRPGEIILAHANIPKISKIADALPEIIKWAEQNGYTFAVLKE